MKTIVILILLCVIAAAAWSVRRETAGIAKAFRSGIPELTKLYNAGGAR